MNLTFLNPAYLFGLFAAAIPIIIHLLSRKKALIYRFAAIDFILRSHRKVARRLRLKQLILIILRTLMIALLALSLARPLLKRPLGVAFSQPEPSSSVIVIDNSFSMGYQFKGESLFTRAKKAAGEIVDSLKEEDNASIALCNSSAQPLLPDLTFDRSALKKVIAEAQISAATTDIGNCLNQARQTLSSSSLTDKYIYLLTDLTKNGWRAESFLKRRGEEDEKIRIKVIDLSPGEKLQNRAINRIKVAPVFRERGREYSFKIEVENLSPEPTGELLCQLFIKDQEINRGFLRIPAWERMVKEFSYPQGGGGMIFGRVNIVPDNLIQDNVRYFKYYTGREI
ncbi:MAG: BatA domain-containing protein, partial [Deltaproteobacteria bacterium]